MNAGPNVLAELQNIKNWKKTHKKSYEIWVCKPPIGTHCENKFEGTKYVTNENKQFILSGTAGEQWVIDGNKLAKTYTFADGLQITPETINAKSKNGVMNWTKVKTRPDAGVVWAFHLPLLIRDFPVNTSWGDVLLANRTGVGHGKGDFIMASDCNGEPNLNDVWVVNGVIFPRTYDLHAFPGMFAPDEYRSDNCELPKGIVGLDQNCINTANITNNILNKVPLMAKVETVKTANAVDKACDILKATLCKEGFRVDKTPEGKSPRLDINKKGKNNYVIVEESDSKKPDEITMYCIDKHGNKIDRFSFNMKNPAVAKEFVTKIYRWIALG